MYGQALPVSWPVAFPTDKTHLSFTAALPWGSEKTKLPMLFFAPGYVLPLYPPGDPFEWNVLLSLLHFPAAV